MRFQHLLSGGSFRTDTPISVSVLNLTVIFLRREQIPSCVFLSSYYQGEIHYRGEKRVCKNACSRFSPGNNGHIVIFFGRKFHYIAIYVGIFYYRTISHLGGGAIHGESYSLIVPIPSTNLFACKFAIVGFILTIKKQRTKFSSANFQKMLSSSYIILRIQRQEGKLCRSK